MANTVNDVMNVIANPDYGIKNIAGTNKEILAILQGTHNSENNIYNIVDDVRNLLQKLVDSNSKNKPVEIGGNNQAKINNKHIQDILDETKGIRKAIDNLSKALLKQVKPNMPAVAKLSDKASEIVANAMVKSIDKNKGGGLSSLIDSFRKLKDISLKDIIFGKTKMNILTKIFNDMDKDLKIKKKDLNNIIKLINVAPEIVKSLIKVSLGVHIVAKSNVIKKLSEILTGENNSLLSLSNLLNMNKKEFSSAAKSAKNVSEIVGGLFKATMLLSTIVVTGVPALLGITLLEKIVNKLTPTVKDLSKNKKYMSDANETAVALTAITGLMTVSSLFLSTIAVTGVPALLGATLFEKTVKKLTPTVKELSKNKKYTKDAIGTAVALTAITGLMAVSSLLLATVAVTGVPALLGSVLMFGIVKVCTSIFKTLSKASIRKKILIGASSLVLMSGSLLLFGMAIKKIVDATKEVSFKQVGIIAATTAVLGGAVALLGIPAVSAFIITGSIVMAIMGLSLTPFAKSLVTISRVSEKLNMKSIALISNAMKSLSHNIAKLSILTVPVTAGSILLKKMSKSIYEFAKSLKLISTIDTTNKQVYQLLKAMKSISNFFIENPIKKKTIRQARRYKRMLKPFIVASQRIAKLKEIGAVPMKLVYQTLNAMRAISNYYIDNPIKKKAIKQSERYKDMLKPFSNAIKQLAKLKELGVIPMKLVHQTLNAIKTIANYYMDNPIKNKAIRQSKKYKDMLKPFSNAIKQLAKLKELGVIPMKLVHQTLKTMSAIANYYIENPIRKKAIRQAKKYKDMLKPFGYTIKHLSKLKELGIIPIKLVHQTLKTMSAIANYYMDNPIKKKAIRQARKYKDMLRPFGSTVTYLSKLKELGSVPMKLVKQVLNAMSEISNFYREQDLYSFETNDAKNSATSISRIMSSFSDSVKSMQQLSNLKNIPLNTISSIINAVNSITNANPTNLIHIGESMKNALSNINSVNMDKVQSVTNMFSAFNEINKSESIIDKFTKSVNEFTEACKNLMDAMGNNTDAINNMDTSGNRGFISTNGISSESGENSNNTIGIRIANVDEIARTIAEKINGALSVDIPDTQVQLLINGIGGNEWTISKY